RTELALRFDYGRTVPWVTRTREGTLRAVAGPHMVTLDTPVRLHGENLHTVGEFTVAVGERVPFVLTYGASHQSPAKAVDADAALATTEHFWRQWVAHGNTGGEWGEAITRSLITLKALTYKPTGGIVA